METWSIDQPLNREVLAYLMGRTAVYHLAAGREPPSGPAFRTEEETGLDDLRTHPDLGGLLTALSRQLPGVTHGYVLGCDVLVNPKGIIFTVATGMAYMAFRANPPSSQPLPPAGKGGVEDLSREWCRVSPFGEPDALNWLKPLAEKALDNVSKLA